MNINEIITKTEYIKKRSAKEFFEWMTSKNKELASWAWEHSDTEKLRTIKYRELNKGLPDKFTHEFMPFAYYAKNDYGFESNVIFRPCCDSERYDGIVFNGKNRLFVEITDAKDGKRWALQKELLVIDGHSPWKYNILGVKENKTKLKRSVSDIITDNNAISGVEHINTVKNLVKATALAKCEKSVKPKSPYGKNNTILIVTFDDTGFGLHFNEKKQWGNLVDFKRKEIDSMEHNFKKIILFGWLNKEFID